MTRTYSELISIPDFKGRYDYLRIGGRVGDETFGFERFLNQDFYRSSEWKRARRDVIARDLGCDLGVDGREIYDRVYVHHMNPMTLQDIEYGNVDIFNPRYLITTSHRTHNAIHYGDSSLLMEDYIPRRPGDTKLW